MLRPTALVTGGASGIGRAICLAFEARNWNVVSADILPCPLGRGFAMTSEAPASTGSAICHVECDAASAADIERAVATTVAAHGGITTLVNNVAIQTHNGVPCHLLDDDVWQRHQDINITSYCMHDRERRGARAGGSGGRGGDLSCTCGHNTVLLRTGHPTSRVCSHVRSLPFTVRFSKHSIPHMLAAGGGSIVNIASVQGLASQAGIPAYAATKGACLSFTRQLANEYECGVCVCAVIM